MSKEDKEAREARSRDHALQEDARRQALVDTYPQRLMTALARAQRVDAIVEVDAAEMSFKVIFRESGAVRDVPYAYDPVLWSEDLLHRLELECVEAEFEHEERRRVAALRESALAKLTLEEQRVLGLWD